MVLREIKDILGSKQGVLWEMCKWKPRSLAMSSSMGRILVTILSPEVKKSARKKRRKKVEKKMRQSKKKKTTNNEIGNRA